MSILTSSWRRSWTKLGLTSDVLKSMFKNALPSTAALWVIRSATLGQQFDTVGFLPIIVTILMTPSLPRIPYLRLLIFNLFLLSIVFGVTLLAGWCSSQARLNTTPGGSSLNDYNSSAAAVSAIWLIATVWALQTFRTYKPHRAKSVILCTIYVVVSLVTTSSLSTMESIITFQTQLFEMFLLGLAFSTVTSLCIFPKSSRDVTSADIATVFDLSQKATAGNVLVNDPGELGPSTKRSRSAAAADLVALSRAFAKFQIDISDAKKDIGWSHFSSPDFTEFTYHFRGLIIALRGLFDFEDIRSILRFDESCTQVGLNNVPEDCDKQVQDHWNILFDKLQQPLSQLNQIFNDAINHCRVSTCVSGSKKVTSPAQSGSNGTASDAEKAARDLPGGPEFVATLKKRLDQQRATLKLTLSWLANQSDVRYAIKKPDSDTETQKPSALNASQGRLLFALYVEHLYNGILDGLLDLVLFCDTKSLNVKPKLQLPGKKRLLNLYRKLIEHHHVEGDIEDIESEIPKLTPQRSRKSVKHRPELQLMTLRRIGTYLDKPFEIFGSPQSFFGLRVACAVMSIAIVGYIEQTHQWFTNRRGIWAAVFIPFSMAPSSGEAKAMLIFRVLGTLLSIPISLANWYMVNGVPAGVIVFYFVFAFIQQYFLVKYPKWGSFWRPCLITYSIIIGYSLQDRLTNVPQPPATTNDDYPIYLIGPYRGLCTLVGVAVAYVWTVFPKPTTANSVMCRRLGQSLFGLAEYHSCMYWAIMSWASGHQGDMRDKSSVAHKLMKERQKLFVKEAALLAVIRDQHEFASFDLTLGGAFPEHRYMEIADEIDRIMTYLNVVIYVSARFHTQLHDTSNGLWRTGPWESGVEDLVVACRGTAKQLASLIHILASSVINNQPLPPFLETPEPFEVARKLRAMRPDLMTFQHVHEEGYKAFAVIEISVAMMIKSLDKILTHVRDMVGEVGVDEANFHET